MTNWRNEGEKKLDALIEKIENHPLTARIREEQALETLSERQQAAGQIEALRREQAEAVKRLQAVCSEKEAKFMKARAAFEVASSEYNQARQECRTENQEFERLIGVQEAVLIESADVVIDDGIRFFRDHLDWLRSPGRIDSRAGGSERNIFAWTKKTTSETNKGAILAAMTYCQQAVKELETMKLQPECDILRIQAMKDKIPSIDIYQEVSGEKPIGDDTPGRVHHADDGHVSNLIEKVDGFLKSKKLKTAF